MPVPTLPGLGRRNRLQLKMPEKGFPAVGVYGPFSTGPMVMDVPPGPVMRSLSKRGTSRRYKAVRNGFAAWLQGAEPEKHDPDDGQRGDQAVCKPSPTGHVVNPRCL